MCYVVSLLLAIIFSPFFRSEISPLVLEVYWEGVLWEDEWEQKESYKSEKSRLNNLRPEALISE